MFKQDADQRLHLWFEFRNNLESSSDPLQEVVDFWDQAPRILHNHLIDHYFDRDWPTPWEIIDLNKYDDFTVALMMGWTILMTERFENSQVEIRTIVDDHSTRVYNAVCVDNTWALNFQDHTVIPMDSISSLYRTENIVPLKRPR